MKLRDHQGKNTCILWMGSQNKSHSFENRRSCHPYLIAYKTYKEFFNFLNINRVIFNVAHVPVQ